MLNRNLKWEMLHPRMTVEQLGFLSGFLSEDDPSPAREQIDTNYQHGGGWRKMEGFVLRDDNSIRYPGDPPLVPLASTKLRDELIIYFAHDWVAIIQPDRSFEVARID